MFCQQMVMERAGRNDGVLKFMPPLVITEEELLRGARIVKDAINHVTNK
jgi:diaminobutyrate-2-oxoglutarate transaminase